VGAGLGGFILAYLTKNLPADSPKYAFGLGAASWISLTAAAFACSLELAASGTISFFKVAGAMLGTHALIGIGESLITVGLYFGLALKPVKASAKSSAAVPLLAAGIIALLLSPFASGLPDGLEWVAQKYQFLHESAPAFVSLVPGYAMPAVNNEILATGLAGLLGVAIVFSAATLLAKLLNRCRQVV
ncbi:MAG: cobalamin biosynthesis protein CbiM, partial [Candidatus Omnitrophica bacterium]|nr:cobalamin biosynthesis protein CbiM [Candidatus Omnitrophota bacterium]MBD3269579.1 cobalamin biosynthesis protein CbiM [Candidatus Omnitrophota bacterium]